jgi:hypothetical protein
VRPSIAGEGNSCPTVLLVLDDSVLWRRASALGTSLPAPHAARIHKAPHDLDTLVSRLVVDYHHIARNRGQPLCLYHLMEHLKTTLEALQCLPQRAFSRSKQHGRLRLGKDGERTWRTNSPQLKHGTTTDTESGYARGSIGPDRGNPWSFLPILVADTLLPHNSHASTNMAQTRARRFTLQCKVYSKRLGSVLAPIATPPAAHARIPRTLIVK